MICEDDFVKNRKKLWEGEWCSEGQWKVKEIVRTMMRNSRKIKRNCENDDGRFSFQIQLWPPPAKPAPFSPFYLLFLLLWLMMRKVIVSEKDDHNDRKGDSFQHRHEIVLILSVREGYVLRFSPLILVSLQWFQHWKRDQEVLLIS